MVRSAGQEIIVIEKEVVIYNAQVEGACHRTRVSQDAEGARGRHGQEPLLCFLWEGIGEAG